MVNVKSLKECVRPEMPTFYPKHSRIWHLSPSNKCEYPRSCLKFSTFGIFFKAAGGSAVMPQAALECAARWPQPELETRSHSLTPCPHAVLPGPLACHAPCASGRPLGLPRRWVRPPRGDKCAGQNGQQHFFSSLFISRTPSITRRSAIVTHRRALIACFRACRMHFYTIG